jgi:hypothetical protein
MKPAERPTAAQVIEMAFVADNPSLAEINEVVSQMRRPPAPRALDTATVPELAPGVAEALDLDAPKVSSEEARLTTETFCMEPGMAGAAAIGERDRPAPQPAAAAALAAGKPAMASAAHDASAALRWGSQAAAASTQKPSKHYPAPSTSSVNARRALMAAGRQAAAAAAMATGTGHTRPSAVRAAAAAVMQVHAAARLPGPPPSAVASASHRQGSSR